MIDRGNGGRAMPFGEVELNASRYPCTSKGHQAWLDHAGTIEDLLVVGLVEGRIQVPSKLWQNNQSKISVFQKHRPIRSALLDPCQIILHSVRINALISGTLKRRIGIFHTDSVGGDHKRRFPRFDPLSRFDSITDDLAFHLSLLKLYAAWLVRYTSLAYRTSKTAAL